MSEKLNTKNLNIKINDKNNKEHSGGTAVNVGNPHIIFFVNEIDNFDIKKIGPNIENHKIFPEKCNVTIAQVIDKNLIKVKVWERGAGLTKACGTAACATAFAGKLNNLTNNKTDIEFENGKLTISIDEKNSIHMKGPVSDIKEIEIKIIMGIFDKFKIGFKKSASALTSGIKEIIIKKEIDDENLNKIEEFLIQSDVGVEAASEIKEIISTKKIDPKKDLSVEINQILKEYIISLMKPLENNSFFEKKDKLNATLISGVNGVGKTTTIGKIGKILKTNGNKVMFAASDTFRAAAIEQLENWANKVNVQITKSSQGSDPASVAYKAVEEAIKNNFNQVLIDTAGRLQNKKNLMEEYKKIAM